MLNRSRNKSKNQRAKPGPKTSYTKDGCRLVVILPPSLIREIEKIVDARGANRRVIVQEALMRYVQENRISDN